MASSLRIEILIEYKWSGIGPRAWTAHRCHPGGNFDYFERSYSTTYASRPQSTSVCYSARIRQVRMACEWRPAETGDVCCDWWRCPRGGGLLSCCRKQAAREIGARLICDQWDLWQEESQPTVTSIYRVSYISIYVGSRQENTMGRPPDAGMQHTVISTVRSKLHNAVAGREMKQHHIASSIMTARFKTAAGTSTIM